MTWIGKACQLWEAANKHFSIMPEEEEDSLIGVTVKDYILSRLLGRGAMGMVYLGQHKQTGQQVAVKFLSGEFSEKKEFVNRFMNEAMAASTLNHENIVHVYETGRDEDGTHFMVMEYIDGVDLSHFLEVQDKVKEAQVLPWLKQSARALAYAHSHGIVHRDIKPENIMLTHEDNVKIADMGLSKNLEVNEKLSMTMSGTFVGTPYYISPEQARDSKHVDARTDIYSLGATFYHLVTGQPPFQGNSAAEVMAKHMDEPLVDPQRKNVGLSDGLSDLIMKMMEKEPAKRFQNMEELVEAIERLERGEPVIPHKMKLKQKSQHGKMNNNYASPPTPLPEKQHIRWTRGLVGVVGGIGVTVLIGIIFFFVLHRNKSTMTFSYPSTVKVTDGGSKKGSSPGGSSPLLKKEEEGTASMKEDEPLSLRGEEGFPIEGSMNTFNWVDGFGVFAILFGIPAVSGIGWLWGSIRAIAFWLAVMIVCSWFEGLASWLKTNLAIPLSFGGGISFCVLSFATMLPLWILTNRLIGYEKETWQHQLSHKIIILPGLVLGGAFATWFLALLALVASNTFPIAGSWIGSRVMTNFPSIQQFSKVSK